MKHLHLQGLEVIIEMPPARVVWLDTSVVLRWAMHRAGRQRDERYDTLMPLLQDGIAGGRLVVVAGEQEEEVTRDWEVFRSLSAGLAGDAKFHHKMEIEEHELLALMRAWLHGQQPRVLRSRVFSPEALRRDRVSPFVFSLVWGDEEARRHRALQRRRATADVMDERRVENRQHSFTFEDARRREVAAMLDNAGAITAEAVASLLRDGPSLEAGFGIQALERLHRLLRSASQDDDVPVDRLQAFFHSDHALAVPSLRVKGTLLAHLMLDSATIVRGDLGDVEHLKIAIPYADVVVADRKMVAKAKLRRLDHEFDTTILAMRDFEQILQVLGET